MKHFEIATAIRADLLAGIATEEARAEYRAIRKTYAAERDALVAMHSKSYAPGVTVADLVNAIGYDDAVVIVAMMVRTKGEWDERIGAKVRAWAADIVPLTADEIRETLDIYYADAIHPVHLDQIARAMMAYTPAETEEITETTDSLTETESPAESEEIATETKSPATLRTLDLLHNLDTGDHGDRLNDYRDTDAYICDAIAEIADADTSIYYNDILDFIRENPESLADAISEGLYDPSHDYDLYKHGQAAEYMTIERDIYDHLPDSLFAAAVNFIRFDLDIVEIPAELAELLREWCEDADTGDRMDEIPDRVREYLADFTEEVTAEDARNLPDFTSPEAFFCEPD